MNEFVRSKSFLTSYLHRSVRFKQAKTHMILYSVNYDLFFLEELYELFTINQNSMTYFDILLYKLYVLSD